MQTHKPRHALSIFALLASLASQNIALADWPAPDPSPQPVIAPDLKLHTTLNIPFPDSLKFVWTYPPSNKILFAVQEASLDCSWKILDLKSGKLANAARTGELDNAIASDDQKYVAGIGVDRGAVCQVCSLIENKTLLTLRPEHSITPTALGFLPKDDSLLTCIAWEQKTEFTQTNPETAKTIKTYSLPLTLVDGGWSFSPGRKYLAILNSSLKAQTLDLVDLDAGRIVSPAPVPAPKTKFAFTGHPIATTFSRDGIKLAILFEAGTKNRLVEWDMTTGQIETDITDFKFQPVPPMHEQGPMLEILPGNKAVRISHFTYDLKTGEQLAAIHHPQGDAASFSCVQMLSDTKAFIATTPGITIKSAKFMTKSVDPINQ